MYFLQWPVWWICEAGSNEDESRWELAGESLHECFLNSHCSVKRAVRVAWELTRVFLLFSISLFLLVASTLLRLRFLTLVKLLTVRVITPIVTCRWYVIIFSFFLLLLMGNDLEIAGLLLQLSTTLVQLSWPVKRAKPHIDLIKIWTSSKLMRVDERWWELAVQRAKPLMDSRQNLNQLKVDESWWEMMRVGGPTSQTSHGLSSKFEPAQSWRECMRVDESWRSNESESCDSHPLSSSFDQAL